MKRLLIVILISAIFFWWFFTRKEDFNPISRELDERIESFLLEEGIESCRVTNNLEKKGRKKWVYVEREIDTSREFDYLKFKRNLNQVLGRDFQILAWEKDPNGISLWQIGRGPMVFQQLVIKESSTPQVALIVDDVGYVKRDFDEFRNLEIPLTFSILPALPNSKKWAEKIKAAGFQILLHLPLQPLNGKKDAGPGALFVNMEKQRMREVFENNIKTVPGAVGVNNHMGSLFTADRRAMGLLLEIIKKKALFFFDSLTTPKSQVAYLAPKLGMLWARNDVFLDVQDNPEFISRQFRKLLAIAKSRGYATAIFHFQRKNTLPVVRKFIREFKRQNVKFVFLSHILEGHSIVRE